MLDIAGTSRHRSTIGGVVMSTQTEAPQAAGWTHRHLLDVDQLSRAELHDAERSQGRERSRGP